MSDIRGIFAKFKELPQTDIMPSFFIGHGSPMNAVENNSITNSWQDIGRNIPSPQAILCISAHWVTPGSTQVTTNESLKTIYDFYGFPDTLYQLDYDVIGSPEFAAKTREMIQSSKIIGNTEWGIDHGAWSVLIQMYPQKNIPVYQMSLDYNKPFSFHLELGRELASLRNRGVLIIGSGNLVHNLGKIHWNNDTVYDWNIEFDSKVTQYIRDRNFEALTQRENFGDIFSLAHPSYDHYLPLLYFVGTSREHENIFSFNEEFQMGSLSMKSFISF